jgi:hypothetical protein
MKIGTTVSVAAHPVAVCVLDLLEVDGDDLRDRPLLEQSNDGRLRQPCLLGLRDDKCRAEVVREWLR